MKANDTENDSALLLTAIGAVQYGRDHFRTRDPRAGNGLNHR
jgi:hypothetical protein